MYSFTVLLDTPREHGLNVYRYVRFAVLADVHTEHTPIAG